MFLCTPSLSVKRAFPGGEASPVRCKRWSCPHCAEVNRRRIIALAMAGKPTAMLTLTVSSNNYETPDEAARDLKRGLVALRKRIARSFGKQVMSFLAVFEKHKSGWPHLHLLIRAPFIKVQWLRAAWEQITGSFMVDIRQIKSTGLAAFYVAKYIGKDLAAFANCKRWWRSHDYNEPRKDDEAWQERVRGWWRTTGNAYSLARYLAHHGIEVKAKRDGRFTWVDPPGQPVDIPKAAAAADAWYGFGYRRSSSGAAP